MIFLKNLYASLLFYFYSNNRVTLTNDTGSISVVCHTYYNGNIDGFTINKTNDDSNPINLEVKNEDTNSVIKTILFVSDTSLIHPSPSIFYIFKKTDAIPYSQSDLFFNPRILKVALEAQTFSFLLRNIKIQSMAVTVNNTHTATGTLLMYLFCLVSLYLIFRFSRSFIKRLSKLDPVFSDFNIVSSNIKKFSELEDRKMTECTICFEEFVSDDNIRILDCKHYYHPRCIDRWLIGHSKRCPCCRVDIEINERV